MKYWLIFVLLLASCRIGGSDTLCDDYPWWDHYGQPECYDICLDMYINFTEENGIADCKYGDECWCCVDTFDNCSFAYILED